MSKFASSKKTRLALVFALGVFILGNALNRSMAPAKSELQSRFETWVSQIDQAFSKTENPSTLNPVLTLRLFSVDKPSDLNYQISSSDFPEAAERLLRIVHIAEEANLFTVTSWSDKPGPNTLALVVQRGEQVFRTQLPIPSDNADLKLRTMLKLFQVYALEFESKKAQMLAQNKNSLAPADQPAQN